MPWTYEQATGKLRDEAGEVVAVGYSGCGTGKNNCEAQDQHNVGPIPVGSYTICNPMDSPKHGPYAMALMPAATNEMHGRSGFMIHGDSIQHPGAASEGCVILDRGTRGAIWTSPDHVLKVIAKEQGE